MVLSFPVAVEAVLDSGSEEDERQALTTLVELGESNGDEISLWTAIDISTTERLLVYVFTRMFVVQGSSTIVFKDETIVVAEGIPALARSVEVKSSIQKLLNQLQRMPWSSVALGSLDRMIQQIEDPRVRQHVIQFGYGVVQRWVSNDGGENDGATHAVELLVLGITDVWSAVRKQSAHAAATIALNFPTITRIDTFLGSLLKIASSDDWKAQEGALLTLTAIIALIQAESSTSAISTDATPSRAADMIRGGSTTTSSNVILFHLGDRHRNIAHLPRTLTLKLKPTLYTALKHNQLSVREAAAQCFVHYVEICDESTRVLTFQEVMSKLNRLTPESVVETDDTHAIDLLDAAEAEGLLDVLAKLVPHVPMTFLIKHWKVVSPTLERYVMHIASTVRQRSSAVVLALAELALVESSTSHSIELLYQMLVVLAEPRGDIGVCWQRLEGRLLSVDLLVGLLGKDHLWRMGTKQSLLILASRSRPTRPSSPNAWLSDPLIGQATWALEEMEELQFFQRTCTSPLSIVARLSAHVGSKNRLSSEFWPQILGGWLQQTREAFRSTQFELRRIGRQVLPGLVRLCLWCNQLPLIDTLATADAKSSSLDAWMWMCLRHAVLHIEWVREWDSTHQWIPDNDRFVLTTLKQKQLKAVTSQDEPEAVVARVEAILLVTLSHQDPANVALVTCALRDVHNNLPEGFRNTDLISESTSPDGSLDRQFSTALVTLLPSVVHRLVVANSDLGLWRMLERIVLSWLVTDDMFRWITVDKRSAQLSLLLALRELLASTELTSVALTSDKLALVVRTLEASTTSSRSDSVSDTLVDIYASLWRVTVTLNVPHTLQQTIITNLAVLYQQQSLVMDSSKTIEHKSEWDDWDNEDDTLKTNDLRPTSALDDGVSKSLHHLLSPELVNTLAQAMQRLLDSGDEKVLQHHTALQALAHSIH